MGSSMYLPCFTTGLNPEHIYVFTFYIIEIDPTICYWIVKKNENKQKRPAVAQNKQS